MNSRVTATATPAPDELPAVSPAEGQDSPAAPAAEARPASLSIACRPARTIAALIVSDVFCLLAAALLSTLGRYYIDGLINGDLYVALLPALGLFLIAFAGWQLYPVVGFGPAEEFRRTSVAITFVYAGLAASTYLFHADKGYSRLVFGAAWLFSLGFVPLGRALVRKLYSHRDWWGYPVLVLGAGETGRRVVRILQRQPGLGLKPVALLDDDPRKHGPLCPAGVPPVVRAEDRRDAGGTTDSAAGTEAGPTVRVVGRLEMAAALSKTHGIRYGIMAMPNVPSQRLIELLERYGSSFPHLVVIPDMFGFSSLQVGAKDLGGVLGLEVRQQLLLWRPCLAKRMLDLLLTSLGLLLIAPLLLAIALAIKLTSRGSVFYIQQRLGQDGKRFRAYKFRTMHGDGERRLQEVLDANPELRREYEVYHKLKSDPRVTAVGRLLRKYSLDELPQLWNVLKCDMSLVGPRPYLEREIPQMDEKEALILKVRPGITGIWQVSARNEVSFAERVNMDVYYVRNWSPWLDIYLLARTFGVVLSGTGS